MKRCIIKRKIKFGSNENVTYICMTKHKNMQKTLSQIRKEAKAASKFVIKMDGLDLYIAARQPKFSLGITADINKAMKFSVGFDNEIDKSKAWSVSAQLLTNNKDVVFNAFYL